MAAAFVRARPPLGVAFPLRDCAIAPPALCKHRAVPGIRTNGIQCAAMEACRGQIAASNYIAANSRMLILDSQATINKCEVDIPTRKLELKQHLLKCKHELHKMNARLKIVMGDIAVMTMILEMTDCEKKLLQMQNFALFHCTGERFAFKA